MILSSKSNKLHCRDPDLTQLKVSQSNWNYREMVLESSDWAIIHWASWAISWSLSLYSQRGNSQDRLLRLPVDTMVIWLYVQLPGVNLSNDRMHCYEVCFPRAPSASQSFGVGRSSLPLLLCRWSIFDFKLCGMQHMRFTTSMWPITLCHWWEDSPSLSSTLPALPFSLDIYLSCSRSAEVSWNFHALWHAGDVWGESSFPPCPCQPSWVQQWAPVLMLMILP